MLQAPGLQPQSPVHPGTTSLRSPASQPHLSATAAGLYQHLPNNKLNWLIRNRVTQLIELLFYNSRLEKTWETRHEHPVFGNEDRAVHKFKEVVQAMHWNWPEKTLLTHQSTDLFWRTSDRRWRSCSGWGGGGLALGEEVEGLLWVRRQTPWDKLHVTFLTLYSSRVSSTVTVLEGPPLF